MRSEDDRRNSQRVRLFQRLHSKYNGTIVMSGSKIILATLSALLISTFAISAQASGQTGGQLEAQPASSSPLGPPVAPATSQPWQPRASDLTVRYESGKLTVVAHGATLQSVLQLIAQRTGTAIESTGWFDAGQVYVELGPATVQEVLTDLLNGSSANYVMLGSQSNPGFVERLVISPRSQAASGASSQSPVVAAAQPAPKPQVYGARFTADPNGSNVASVTTEAEREPPSTALPPVQNIDPSMAKFQEAYNAAAASGKSRGEILQELQRQQLEQLAAQAAQAAQAAESTPH